MQANGTSSIEVAGAGSTNGGDKSQESSINSTTIIQQQHQSSGAPSSQAQQQQHMSSSASPNQNQPQQPHQQPQQSQSQPMHQQNSGSNVSTGSNHGDSNENTHSKHYYTGSNQPPGGYHNHRSSYSGGNQGGGGGHRQHYHQHHHHTKYNSSRADNESNINHVLLITVINPHYTINCELIHQICSTYGKVNRIVIFRKNGVQAMVEFDNVDSAKRAKSALHGCDIYSGCCTLKIEFAKPTRLNVHKNDSDNFDYTNPSLGNNGAGSISDQDSMNPSSINNHSQASSSTHHHHQHHHSMYHHSAHGINHHSSHHARGPGSNRRGGHYGSNDGQQSFHPSQHHKQQQPTSQHQDSPDYIISAGAPLDQQQHQQTPGGDSFHQDGGFNVSRSGGASGGGAYVDSYNMPAHGGGNHIHQAHGSPYSRHDGHHHHHHHHHHPHQHHSRSALGPPGSSNHNPPFSPANSSNALVAAPTSLSGPHSTVMMVYGLNPERFNCDRLFNLFCLYGNVDRVKFLKTKEGCAMVQMGDVEAVDRCVSSLNKIILFGNELQISYSKQTFLHEVLQPFILPDGSPSFKDFLGNKNNRFKNPEAASKNRILPPSQVLHFFSAPLGITENELTLLFKRTAGYEPVSLKIFTPKADNIKSFSGLVTFRDASEATETLVLCNHKTVPTVSTPKPYILRLCYSPSSYPRSASYAAPSSQ